MKQVFLQRPPRAGDRGLQVDDDLVQVDHPRRDQRDAARTGRWRRCSRCRRPAGAARSRRGRTRSGHRPPRPAGRARRGACRTISRIRPDRAAGSPPTGRRSSDPAAAPRPPPGWSRAAARRRRGRRRRSRCPRSCAGRGRSRWRRMRKDLGHRLPGLAVGRQRHDLHRGMGRDEADELGAGVARGAEDGDLWVMGSPRSGTRLIGRPRASFKPSCGSRASGRDAPPEPDARPSASAVPRSISPAPGSGTTAGGETATASVVTAVGDVAAVGEVEADVERPGEVVAEASTVSRSVGDRTASSKVPASLPSQRPAERASGSADLRRPPE